MFVCYYLLEPWCILGITVLLSARNCRRFYLFFNSVRCSCYVVDMTVSP